MTQTYGKVISITGAASGLGRALAVALAPRCKGLALADIDEPGLHKTIGMLPTGAAASMHVVDVRQQSAVERFAREVEAQHGGVDIVINNAGMAALAAIEDVSYETLTRILEINLWGVIYGTKEFLPLLRKRGVGHIVNVGSVNAYVPFPSNGAYTISKYAILGLCETLMQELHGSGIQITCVHPGSIRTNIIRKGDGFSAEQRAYFDKVAQHTPEYVANAIIKGIEKNREQLLVGADALILAWAKRIAPRWIVKFVGKKTARPRANVAEAVPLAPEAPSSASSASDDLGAL